jgi:SAM-dependent methyltransferase
MNRTHGATLPREQMPDHSAVWSVPEDDARLRKDIEHQLFEKAAFHRDLLRSMDEVHAQRVLEVGAGSTIDSCCLATRVSAEFHALDLVESSMHLARRVERQFPGAQPVRFHLGDAFDAPFEDGFFDVVFHQGLLEHFTDPVPLLRENLRVLREGGILLVDVPQRYSLYTLLKHRRMRRGEWPWGWEREYSAGEMRRLADGLPMELVRLSSWGYDFYTSIARWPREKLRRKNPLRDTRLCRALDTLGRRGFDPAWELPWRWLERRYGPHFMMNVTGIYRRTS